jgi:hypothetical protein
MNCIIFRLQVCENQIDRGLCSIFEEEIRSFLFESDGNCKRAAIFLEFYYPKQGVLYLESGLALLRRLIFISVA